MLLVSVQTNESSFPEDLSCYFFYHSHSMINEPCVVNEFYLDALAIVEAETLDDALKLLEERKEGWRVEDLRELEPIVVPLTGAKVIYTHIRGSIDHL